MAKKLLLVVLVIAAAGAGIWIYKSRTALPPPVDAGLPVYPGARNVNADTFSARLSPRDRARLVKAVIYETADPSEKVIAFYKEKLQGKTQVFESKRARLPAAVIRTEITGAPRLIMITANEDTGKTEITIGHISQEPIKQP